MRSLLLSVRLSIEHLRSFEKSERTTNASLALLQLSTHSFSPHQIKFLAEIDALALEVGGGLMPRNWSWKVSLLVKLIGWKATSQILMAVRRAKLATLVKWDEILSK